MIKANSNKNLTISIYVILIFKQILTILIHKKKSFFINSNKIFKFTDFNLFVFFFFMKSEYIEIIAQES